ncbi:MAG: hypothetical protein BJ554DRAFT_2 [Olpidium bornovanus]|uniref:Uncharacterized protein n=1 Tax=Olpidium bornovanus TaxID=278681 RepID=A0A8H7ZTZ3_9FUNG|nr:MAG: hypothetical protein BJ554DRAFT_2 [Olpidium bornovanus]
MSIIITFTTTGVSMVLLISHGYYRRWRDPTLRPSPPPPESGKPAASPADKPGGERKRKSKAAPFLQPALDGASGVIRTAALTEGDPDMVLPFAEATRGWDADAPHATSVNRRPSSVSFAGDEVAQQPVSRF